MVQICWAILQCASNRFWPHSQLFICCAHSPLAKKPVRREECSRKTLWKQEWEPPPGIEAKCAFDGLAGILTDLWRARVSASQIWYVRTKRLCLLLFVACMTFLCMQIRTSAPHGRNANARDARVGIVAYAPGVFKRVRFYCPFFSIIFYNRSIKMLSQRCRLLFFFPVCFIRTFGPRIFNQSAKGFSFCSNPLPHLCPGEWEAFSFFSPRIPRHCAVHISLHKEIPRLLSADASELCRRCNMTLNWISVCLTCRLTDWLSDWLTAECLQSLHCGEWEWISQG